MAKVTSAFGRPIQGVSQQPNKVRRDGQCSLQENMNPSVVEGLKARPGTKTISKLMNSVAEGTKIHHYRRGDDEEYFIIISPNSLPLVFNAEGQQQVVVNQATDSNYYRSSNPDLNLELVTISDFTFIVNRTVPVTRRDDRSPALVNEALLYVQFANYGKYYQVIVDGVIAGQFQAPSGELPEHVFAIDTSKVAAALINGGEAAEFEDSFLLEEGDGDYFGYAIATLPPQADTFIGAKNPPDLILPIEGGTLFLYEREDLGTPIGEPGIFGAPYPGSSLTIGYEVNAAGLSNLSDFLITQTGNVVHIRRRDGADFTIETVDGADGQDLVALKGLLTDIGKLPPYAPDGFTIKIQNSGKSDDSGYWLRAVDRGGNTVKWAEVIAPDTLLGFNKKTMPYVLVRQGVSAGVAIFELREGQWEDRKVGDEFSNPFSSIVDEESPQPIQTIGVFQNRLFLTSGESVNMSRSGEFFDFFRKTTQVLSDDDPVGGFADSNQINSLVNSVILDSDLVFFSRNSQFRVDGREIITNANFTVSQTNSFESITQARPVASGESIFFAFINGRYTGIREYFTDSLTDTKRARPVTEHVDKYIEGTARRLVTSPNTNWLLVTTDKDLNVVYAYNWLWVGDEKAQSAWHKWVFPGGTAVLSLHFSQDKLYFLIRRFGELWLEVMEVNDTVDPIYGFEVRLDRTVTLKGIRSLVDGYFVHTIADPYPLESMDDLVFVCGEGCYDDYIGASFSATRVGDEIVTSENISDKDSFSVLVGRKYKVRYVPSEPVVKDYRERVIGIDKLMLSRYYINYESTGNVTVTIKGKYGEPRVVNYSGRVLGEPSNIVGFQRPQSGQFVVPIMQKADSVTVEISTEDHVPFELRDIEWSGQFTQRGRRI